MNKKTLVLGASTKSDRYSFKAVMLLQKNGHNVVPLGFEHGTIGNAEIITNWENYNDIDTITLYLNPNRQKQYYNYIVEQKPKRVIFNPGTENDELEQLLVENNITYLEACTLVLLTTGQY
jgi:hypothetical protein